MGSRKFGVFFAIALAATTARGSCALSATDSAYLQHEIQRQAGHYTIMSLAAKKGSPNVRAIGKEGAARSSADFYELKALAHSDHVTVLTKSDLRQRSHYATLYPLSGKDFDSAFIDDTLIDDRIALYAQHDEVVNGHDATLKRFAASRERVLENEISKLEKAQQ